MRPCCGCNSAAESLSQDLIFQRVRGKAAKSAAALGCGVISFLSTGKDKLSQFLAMLAV